MQQSINYATSWFLQVKALLQRRLQSKFNFPIRSILVFFGWPIFVYSLMVYIINVTEHEQRIWLFPFLPILIAGLIIFELMFSISHLLNDKSSKFRSLLFTMGCARSAYFAASFIWTVITTCLILLIPTFMITNFIIEKETDSETVAKIYIYMLLLIPMQYATLPLLFTSFITTITLVLVIYVIISADIFILPILENTFSKEMSDETLKSYQMIASISPNQNLRYFMNNIQTLAKQRGISSINTCMLISALATLLLSVLAYVADLLVPWQPDMPSQAYKLIKLLSIFKRRRRASKINDSYDDKKESSKYIEPNADKRNLVVGVKLENLTKKYKSKTVVDDLSYDIYKGEATLLLGHNGAGKTTTMSMILGTLNPTEGSVIMNFEGPKNLGYCPQDSYLDDSLNCVQHMQLICQIKSRCLNDETVADIDKTLNDVGLKSAKRKLPSEMSGGMKRKLSLGMALVGGSNVLILDEPSSGLDPDSRRIVWDCIRSYRTNRAVLLSTQHMEEADFLGDRIAIMANGRVVCSGSSAYLTNLLGSGYKLRVECATSSIKSILKLVRQFFPSAAFEDEARMQLAVDTASSNGQPLSDCLILLTDKTSSIDTKEKLLIDVIESLENSSEELKITSFSLRASSIEDVMLNTGKINSQSSVSIDVKAGERALAVIMNSSSDNQSTSIPLFNCSFYISLVKKQLREFRRSYLQLLIFTFVLPFIGAWLMNLRVFKDLTEKREERKIKSRLVGGFFPFICLILQFVAPPIREKSTQLKAIFFSSKLSFVTYWLSILTVDLLRFIPAILIMNFQLMNAINRHNALGESKAEISPLAYVAMTTSSVIFGLASMFQCYFLSTQFDEIRKTEIVFFAAHMLQSIVAVLFKVIEYFATDVMILEYWNIVMIISLPNFSYQFSINQLLRSNLITLTSDKFKHDGNGFMLSLLILSSQALVYLFLIYYGEVTKNNWIRYFTLSYWWNKPVVKKTTEIDDEDVRLIREESRKLANSDGVVNKQVVAYELTKRYARNVPVVEGLSFYVNERECFGLLGVNGAGKTTTFNMLVGESRQDAGQLSVCNQKLPNWTDARYFKSNIGFDPQSSPVVKLTPREALRLMAELRELNPARVEQTINALLELLEMQQHADKQVAALSGGNKRKMALGMSLIGSPRLLALDEPTAGVDPLARRSIWKLLLSLRLRNKASIVVSSHAMEECEAICDRISVMASGKLRCIGSFQRLRAKFCQGTIIKGQITVASSIRSSQEAILESSEQILDKFVKHLQATLNTQKILIEDKNLYSVTLNLSDPSVKKSTIFKNCFKFKKKYSQTFHYIINDTSLEDIFIKLAEENKN